MSGDDSRSGLGVEGLVRTHSDEPPVRAHWRVVAADYFATMRIRLLDGRVPTELEVVNLGPVALINRTAAERYWPGQNPIGKRLRILSPGWREIIGVVDDVRAPRAVRTGQPGSVPAKDLEPDQSDGPDQR